MASGSEQQLSGPGLQDSSNEQVFSGESFPSCEVYPSIDPDGLNVQSSKSFEATQNAFHQLTDGLIFFKRMPHNSHAAQGPSLFTHLRQTRTYEDPKIGNGRLEMCQTQSAEGDSAPKSKETVGLDPSDSDTSTCISTSVTNDVVDGRSSSTASDRRSKYQSSGEMWQEDYDVFDQGQLNIPYRRQTSDTNSLPDVILSSNSTTEMTETSPDLLLSERHTGSLTDNIATVGDVPLSSAGESSCTLKEKKLEMEGRVHDPKGRLHRQVSFSKQVSVCEPGFSTTLAANEEKSSASCSSSENSSVNLIGYNSLSESESRSRTSTPSASAEDKRIRYSHRTSGYGTGESSKSSTQNGSTEEIADAAFCSLEDDQNPSETTATCDSQMGSEANRPELSILDTACGVNNGSCSLSSNHVKTSIHVSACAEEGTGSPFKYHSEFIREKSLQAESASADKNRPNLSILMRNSIESAPDNCKALTYILKDREKHPPATATPPSLPQQGGHLPNLSILSRNDSSLMVSASQLPAEERVCDEGEGEVQDYQWRDYLTSSANGETNRTPESDSYALEMLEFQTSASAEQKSQLLQDKTRRYSDRRIDKPLTNKAFAQKVRDDLVANYLEDMLFYLNYTQADSREFEQVMQCIQHAVAPDSSPSPMTPLTPQVRQARGPASPAQKRRFYFENQSLDLQQREKRLQEMLVRSSRCDYYLCADHDCKQGKQLFHDLEKSLLTQPSSKTYIDYTSELFCLFDHSQQCDEFKCPVPWCNFLSWKYSSQRYEEIVLQQVTKKLTEFVLLPTLKFTSMSTNEETFCPLSSRYPAKPVVEGRDWIALMRIGKFGSSVLAKETQTQNDWVVKRVQLTHAEADNRLQVYRRLKDHTAEHIVTYLWMKQTGKVLFVCSKFELGGSLFDHMLTSGPFEARCALHVFSQVLSAASFLHNLKILFLYWNAKNVVLTRLGVAKLSNFSTAVQYEGVYDLEELSSLVPATLLPPELLTDQVSLCSKQDSWGLGCLLKELVTGLSSRQELIHEDRTETERQIRDSPLPRVPAPVDSIVQEILHRCWKVLPEERMSASQLSQFLNITHGI